MEEKIREDSSSKIRIWVKEEEEKNKNTNENLYDVLFGALIYGLTGFNGTLSEKHRIDTTLKLMEEIRQKYSGDTSLFELGCYLFFQIDLWCFRNHYEEWRRRILPFLINRFTSLFEETLNTGNLDLIFNNRLDLYGRAIQGKLVHLSLIGENRDEASSDEKKAYDTIYFYLTQLILMTADNTLPKIYKFNKEKDSLIIPTTLGFFGTYLIFSEILNWEMHVLPASLEAIKNSMIMDEKFTDHLNR